MTGENKANLKSKIVFRPALFWDVDPKTIDQEKHARYIIERILDFGHDDEVRWMWRYYDHSLIKKVLYESRVLLPETRTFWNLILQPTA